MFVGDGGCGAADLRVLGGRLKGGWRVCAKVPQQRLVRVRHRGASRRAARMVIGAPTGRPLSASQRQQRRRRRHHPRSPSRPTAAAACGAHAHAVRRLDTYPPPPTPCPPPMTTPPPLSGPSSRLVRTSRA